MYKMGFRTCIMLLLLLWFTLEILIETLYYIFVTEPRNLYKLGSNALEYTKNYIFNSNTSIEMYIIKTSS